MRFRRFLVPLLAIAVVSVAAGGLAFAQTTGDIQGTVTDNSGAALPGVTCTATSPSLQGIRTSVTSNSGNYRIASLPPGTYKVSCALAGFATVERTANVTPPTARTVWTSVSGFAGFPLIEIGTSPIPCTYIMLNCPGRNDKGDPSSGLSSSVNTSCVSRLVRRTRNGLGMK